MKKYNVMGNVVNVDHEVQASVLNAIGNCVVMTPADEEQFLPSRFPNANDMLEANANAEKTLAEWLAETADREAREADDDWMNREPTAADLAKEARRERRREQKRAEAA